VELEILHPDEPMGLTTYGFCLEGVDGIIACHHTILGADRVRVTPRMGSPFEVSSYVACDPETDLIVLKAPEQIPGLRRGSHLVFSHGETGFVILPPSVPQPTYRMRYVNVVECAGMGDMIGLYGDVSSGLPMADSLGQVVGVVEALRVAGQVVVCGIPIDRVNDLMARPDAGGNLVDLDPTEYAPWTQPPTAEGCQLRGAVLCRIRKLDEGIPLLDRALEMKPDMLAAHLERGMAYQNQAQHSEAEEAYGRALEIKPDYPKAHLYLASCYFMQGKYMRSEQENLAASDLAPDWPLAHVNLGGVYFIQHKIDLAEASFLKALDLAPQMGLAHYNLGMLYHSENRPEEAKARLRYLRGIQSGFASLLSSRTGIKLD
jgi:Flp pilus assembly protein TadD